MNFKKPFAAILIFLHLALVSFSQIPSGYYDPVQGLTGDALKNALHDIIDGHNAQSYDDLWTHFQTTDKKSDGTVWDMYSNCTFTFISDQCGNYGSECDCYNREHSFPKSWFNDAMPMYSDLFHLVPTDGYVNGQRSNFPYGEVGTATYTSSNGCKKGNNVYPGYTGTVFEPVDEYKGDLARGYLYMAVRYKDEISSWSSDMLDGVDGFTDWALNLLLDWHEQDPVSNKEINRNNAIYTIQNNRNPFIDHPEYANQIWVGGTTVSPSITDITITPNSPLPTETVSISANVTDDGTITSVELNWGTTSGSLTNGPIAMSLTKGVYVTDTDIPAQLEGTTVYFKIEAIDDDGNSTITPEQSYTTGGIVVGGGMEDFSNYSNTQGSYVDGTFLGQDGSTWSYIQCRGDVQITNETPCLGRDKTPAAAVYSGTISGGIGSISFDYMQAFSTDAELNVLINDVVIATVTTSNEANVIKNSGNISVNTEGNFVMKFEQASNTAGQVAIDNINWTGYSTACSNDSIFLYEDICQGESFMGFNEEGVHYYIVPKPDGCDSVYEIHLTVHDTLRIVEQESICEGDSILWQGNYYDTEGIYEASYVSVNGCDSTYELHLNLNSTFSFSEVESICEGDSILWQGNYYNENGSYSVDYQTINGCDSSYSLNLTVNEKYYFEETASICNGDSYQWHGIEYNIEGIYFDSLLTINNCDSVFLLNLNVNENPEVFLGSDTTILDTASLILDAGAGFEEYLWNDLYTGQTFTVDNTFGLGSHDIWVMVTNNNDCYGFDTIVVTLIHFDNVNEMEQNNDFRIYPNPVKDKIVVESLCIEYYSVEIYDLYNHLVLKFNENIGVSNFPIQDLPKGTYFLKIRSNSGASSYKIIKN